MQMIQKQARVAGLLYLLVLLSAPIGLIYVPSRLYAPHDATLTAANIRASNELLRIGIVSELLHQILFVFLVLARYGLFKTVNKTHARQVVILGALVSVPIVFVNVLNEMAALFLARGTDFATAFDRRQLDALTLLFMQLHGQGINVVSIFWGLWLFPFGLLVIRSVFIPRILGFLLLLAGTGYLVSSSTTLLLPNYESIVDSIEGIAEFGELPIIFWLLIAGASIPASEKLIA